MQKLLDRLPPFGCRIYLDGDRVLFESAKQLPPDLVADLKQHREQIRSLLGTTPGFCNIACEDFFLGGDTVQCFPVVDERNWKWTRLDRMESCPRQEGCT